MSSEENDEEISKYFYREKSVHEINLSIYRNICTISYTIFLKNKKIKDKLKRNDKIEKRLSRKVALLT